MQIIHGWIDKWGPTLNLGIALNERHVAVDVDPRHGGYKTLRRLEKERGSLDRSLVSSTGGGGLHIFGASDTSVRTSQWRRRAATYPDVCIVGRAGGLGGLRNLHRSSDGPKVRGLRLKSEV